MHPHAQNRAFTLIEVVISLAIFSGIMLLVTMFGLDVANFALQFQEDLYAKQELEIASAIMTVELRSATQAANGSYSIVAATRTSTTFYADANADGRIERLRYFFTSSTVSRGIIVPTGTPATYPTSTEIVTTLLGAVATGSFAYYDSAYTAGSAPLAFPVAIDTVRALRFTATIDPQTSTRPLPQTSSFVVMFRNLRE